MEYFLLRFAPNFFLRENKSKHTYMVGNKSHLTLNKIIGFVPQNGVS